MCVELHIRPGAHDVRGLWASRLRQPAVPVGKVSDFSRNLAGTRPANFPLFPFFPFPPRVASSAVALAACSGLHVGRKRRPSFLHEKAFVSSREGLRVFQCAADRSASPARRARNRWPVCVRKVVGLRIGGRAARRPPLRPARAEYGAVCTKTKNYDTKLIVVPAKFL